MTGGEFGGGVTIDAVWLLLWLWSLWETAVVVVPMEQTAVDMVKRSECVPYCTTREGRPLLKA